MKTDLSSALWNSFLWDRQCWPSRGVKAQMGQNRELRTQGKYLGSGPRLWPNNCWIRCGSAKVSTRVRGQEDGVWGEMLMSHGNRAGVRDPEDTQGKASRGH